MRRQPRILYGWRAGAGFCLSPVAPDVPQVAHLLFDGVTEAERYVASLNDGRLRRTVIVWSGSALAEKQRLDALAASSIKHQSFDEIGV